MKSIVINRALLAVFAFGLLFLTSCKDDLLKVNVPLEYANATFTIKESSVAGAMADTIQVVTNIDSILNANKVDKNKIKSIKIQSLDFTMLDGDATVNFRLLESIKAQMSAGGMSFVTLAELPNNPDEERMTLSMPVNTTVELKDYLTQSSFTFVVSGVTRGPVAHDVTVKAKLKFDLEAGL